MKSIFKSYDVRGLYPTQINEKISYEIGLRVKKILNVNKIVLGRDGRLSSPTISESFIKGALESGLSIINIGQVTSPMLSFFCVKNKLNGIMVTASHNPKEYNGIKFIDPFGIQLGYQDLLKKLELIMAITQEKTKTKGKLINKDSLKPYQNYIYKKFKGKISKKIKFVVDTSNGVGSIPLTVLKKLGLKFIIINSKIDGNFPSHSPDQTKAVNLMQLRQEVIKNKADLGVMFDGDSDRAMFVDEKGKIISADFSFLLLALAEINNYKKIEPIFLCDLRFSKSVFKELSKYPSHIVKMRVGNPFYKKMLFKEKNAILGGEFSGHIMYKENFGIDDPLFALLKMLIVLTKNKKRISELVNEYKLYASSGEMSVEVKNPSNIISTVHKIFKEHEIDELDGISVDLGESWFTIRQSNTEPVIRFIIEGTSLWEVEKQKKHLIRIIAENDRN